jgi:tetraprenyl-beta-curcumene synthase
MDVQSGKSIARASAFAHAARCYWLRVFPCARAELSFWRQRAQQIPDPTLRKAALNALRTKSDLLEGAVAFAVFVPSAACRDVVRAIAAFEIAFDYLDNIVEMPNPDPVLNSRSLCEALYSVIEPHQIHPDYYQHNVANDDGGYLEALVNRCRLSFAKLPSYPVVAEAVHRALLRIATYQSLNQADADGSHDAFREWARSQSVPEMGLQWWETGAAMGSQLSVLALIAAAANSATSVEHVKAIERAYFPWFGALSTLLDSVIDQHIDRTENQWSLIDYYGSPEVTAKRLQLMAVEVRRAVVPLADASNHTMILAAMAAFFHSRPEASTPEAGQVTRAVLHAVGGWAMPALIFFRTQRALQR